MRRLTLLLILVMVGGVVAAAYTLRVTQVRVTGLRTVAAADVIRSSGVEVGQRILWIRLSAAARHVEQLPGVERATATRTLPGTVVIHITERRAVAKLSSTPNLVADSSGRVFESPAKRGIPILDGWGTKKGSRRELDPASRDVLRAYEGFPLALRRPTRHIVVRPSFSLELLGGIEVRFGRPDHVAAKVAAALAVLRAEAGKKIDYIDVQVPTVPVVGPPPTPTPIPTAAATFAPTFTRGPVVTAAPLATPAH
jgi:cell division protein FtsQ